MSDWVGTAIETPSTGLVPTAGEVQDEGQFKLEYFPRCTTEGELTSFLDAVIARVVRLLSKQLGSTWSDARDADIPLLHDAALYLACSQLWQIIKNVMDAYDDEELPPEFVDPKEAAANRDYYRDQAASITERFGGAPDDSVFAAPYFTADGPADDTAELLETWLETWE